MGSYKLKRVGLPSDVLEILEKQNLHTCKDALTLTTTELKCLLGVDYEKVRKIQSLVSQRCVAEPSTVYELYLHQRKNSIDKFFSLSLHTLDVLLQGGLLRGSITELAGPSGVGKTQFCFLLSLLATLPVDKGGLCGQVFYIDTESAFSASRLEEMAKSRYPDLFQSPEDIQSFLQQIIVHRVCSMNALKDIVAIVENEVIRKNIKLVIVDSIASLFRKEYGASGLQNMVERNNILLKQAAILKDLAQTYNIIVFLTNQITSHVIENDPTLTEYFDSEENEDIDEVSSGVSGSPSALTKKPRHHQRVDPDHVIPALGTTWSHCVNTRLVAQFLDPCVRQLTVVKSPVAPNAAVRFSLDKTGIILTGDDVEFVNVCNTEHQNIFTRNNFLTEEVTGTGLVFSTCKQL